MKRVFITRDLQPDSPFLQSVSAVATVTARALIQIDPVSFANPGAYDWIFFSSSNAARCFLRGLTAVPAPQGKLAAIGPGTAQALTQAGHTCDFIGTGHPHEAGSAFREVIKPTDRILFPGARRSLRSIQQQLGPEFHTTDLTVYETTEVPPAQKPVADLLVFTSPSNVRAYFSAFAVDAETACMAIGPSTRKALEAAGVSNILLPQDPSEEALATASREWIAANS